MIEVKELNNDNMHAIVVQPVVAGFPDRAQSQRHCIEVLKFDDDNVTVKIPLRYLRCELTQQLTRDPVLTSKGNFYDKGAIEAYLAGHGNVDPQGIPVGKRVMKNVWDLYAYKNVVEFEGGKPLVPDWFRRSLYDKIIGYVVDGSGSLDPAVIFDPNMDTVTLTIDAKRELRCQILLEDFPLVPYCTPATSSLYQLEGIEQQLRAKGIDPMTRAPTGRGDLYIDRFRQQIIQVIHIKNFLAIVNDDVKLMTQLTNFISEIFRVDIERYGFISHLLDLALQDAKPFLVEAIWNHPFINQIEANHRNRRLDLLREVIAPRNPSLALEFYRSPYIQRLLENPEDGPFVNACQNSDVHTAAYCLQQDPGAINWSRMYAKEKVVHTPLTIAIDVVNPELVILLIEHNADISEHLVQDTLMAMAMRLRNVKLITLLIERGFDVSQADTHSQLMIWAMDLGHAGLINLLIERRANIFSQNNDGSGGFLRKLFVQELYEVIKSQVSKANFDWKQKNELGQTIFHLCCEKENPLMVQWLLERCPADSRTVLIEKSNNGDTALSWSIRHSPECAAVLIQAAAGVFMLDGNKSSPLMIAKASAKQAIVNQLMVCYASNVGLIAQLLINQDRQLVSADWKVVMPLIKDWVHLKGPLLEYLKAKECVGSAGYAFAKKVRAHIATKNSALHQFMALSESHWKFLSRADKWPEALASLDEALKAKIQACSTFASTKNIAPPKKK
jgi:ankyrin repeat protein